MGRRTLVLTTVFALSMAFASCSLGDDTGGDGLPAHCGNKTAVAIDGEPISGPGAVTSFESAAQASLAQRLPRLRVTFPGGGSRGGSGSGAAHQLQVVDTPVGAEATLKNANGLELLRISAWQRDGNWFVSGVEMCNSMAKKFGSG